MAVGNDAFRCDLAGVDFIRAWHFLAVAEGFHAVVEGVIAHVEGTARKVDVVRINEGIVQVDPAADRHNAMHGVAAPTAWRRPVFAVDLIAMLQRHAAAVQADEGGEKLLGGAWGVFLREKSVAWRGACFNSYGVIFGGHILIQPHGWIVGRSFGHDEHLTIGWLNDDGCSCFTADRVGGELLRFQIDGCSDIFTVGGLGLDQHVIRLVAEGHGHASGCHEAILIGLFKTAAANFCTDGHIADGAGFDLSGGRCAHIAHAGGRDRCLWILAHAVFVILSEDFAVTGVDGAAFALGDLDIEGVVVGQTAEHNLRRPGQLHVFVAAAEHELRWQLCLPAIAGDDDGGVKNALAVCGGILIALDVGVINTVHSEGIVNGAHALSHDFLRHTLLCGVVAERVNLRCVHGFQGGFHFCEAFFRLLALAAGEKTCGCKG